MRLHQRCPALWLWPVHAQALPWSFDQFSDAPADHSPKVLDVVPDIDPSLSLSEHGSFLVGSTIILDDASFTTKITIHSGAGVLVPLGWVTLLDTGSPKNFI